jgi:GGDEF domain-containing protein
MFDLVPVARTMVLDAICDGVIVIDRVGRVVDANRAARGRPRARRRNILAEFGEAPRPTRHSNARRGRAIHRLGRGGRWYKVSAIEIEGEGWRHGTAVIFADIDESKRLLVRLATTDELTKVDNRRHFFEHAERELAIARRTARPVSFAMLDLDLFKRVNDARGHAAGDAALVAVCEACREALRSSGILCRYGGEEFMIILPEVAPRDALEIVERVHSDFGVSGYAAGEAELESIELYLRQCDEALYRVKASGRNRVHLYEADF